MTSPAAPGYFTAVSTDQAPTEATDSHYELAGTLTAQIAATSRDPEATKATIWNGVKSMADQGVDADDIIGVLSTTLALFTLEIFNPAVDLMEELHPGFDYRNAVGKTA